MTPSRSSTRRRSTGPLNACNFSFVGITAYVPRNHYPWPTPPGIPKGKANKPKAEIAQKGDITAVKKLLEKSTEASTPKASNAKANAPKANTTKVKVPKANAPKASNPKASAHKANTHKPNVHKANAPKAKTKVPVKAQV